MTYQYPVYDPRIGDDEIQEVLSALRAGEISGTFGKALATFEREFAQYCGVRHGVAVSSGTAALYLAVRVLGIGPGDEVLVSASTNIATALAVYQRSRPDSGRFRGRNVEPRSRPIGVAHNSQDQSDNSRPSVRFAY